MAVRVAIVGPGRVGTALGIRLAASPAVFLGFVGRSAAPTSAALAAVGRGAALAWSDLRRAHVVVFAVGDGDLPAAVAAAMAGGAARSCALWLHTSGCHGLSVFAAAAGHGLRFGALHPLLPIAAPAAATALRFAPALVSAGERSLRLLLRLCHWCGLEPIVADPPRRVVYHAGCALAANGLTALCALADSVLAAAGELGPADRRRVWAALATAAAGAAAEVGPAAALSGPVRRGDAATVAAHLEALATHAPQALAAYRALMAAALELARAAGLPAPLTEDVAAALRRGVALDG